VGQSKPSCRPGNREAAWERCRRVSVLAAHASSRARFHHAHPSGEVAALEPNVSFLVVGPNVEWLRERSWTWTRCSRS